MPGAVRARSTYALNNATLPFVMQIANMGAQRHHANKHLANGLTVENGAIAHKLVARPRQYVRRNG